jgi:hypothetical protein
MTICIAAVCDLPDSPKIVYCADRLVTAGVKYEGLPKVKLVTDSIGVMHSTNDADASGTILQRAITRFLSTDENQTVLNFVNILKDECWKYKLEKLEHHILKKYHVIFERFTVKPEKLLQDARDEIKYYQYGLQCNFLVFGLDFPNNASIVVVDQNGEDAENTSSGFATIGEATGLAFSELTKHNFNDQWPLHYTIPLVFRTKRICERFASVGKETNFGVIYFGEDKDAKERKIITHSFTENYALIKKIDSSINQIEKYEKDILSKISNEITSIIYPKPDQEEQKNN